MRELVPPVNPDLLHEDELAGADGRRSAPDEAGMPRWLHPSVREARFPTTATAVAAAGA